tara:strand:+ start:7080 stop:7715 length:636 start_codon:yes stop_codon:yes gene_type:complete
MKKIAVIQVRLSSNRLRNKALFHIYKDYCVLEMLIKNLKKNIKFPIVLATSSSKNDKHLSKVAKKFNIKFYSGSLNNVRKRLYLATAGYDIIYRFTADNPIVINDLYKMIDNEITKYDMICFKNHIRGTVFQVFKRNKISNFNKCSPFEKEHVIDPKKTNNIKIIDLGFKIKIKLSIDTIEDYFNVKEFINDYQKKYNLFTLKNLKNYFCK